MRQIDIVLRTTFADLLQRGLDGEFQSDFPADGRFVTVQVKGKSYFYFDRKVGERVKRAYVGPVADSDIAARVENFRHLKNDLRARRKLVSILVREGGLPAPDRLTGDIVEKLAAAGFFRLRGVLVGTVAYQTYAGFLGVRLPSASLQTSDSDLAQFHSIATAVDDAMPPILPVLQTLDPTFQEAPHLDGGKSTALMNASRYKIEFLTPNRGSPDHQGHAADMPSLGGIGAQPLRFLDFLIDEPVRSVLLHKNGIPVLVPAPERYAIHKLIVATRRRDDRLGLLKRDKDVMQSTHLIAAMALTHRRSDLAIAFGEAWNRGPAWREGIKRGMLYMGKSQQKANWDIIREGLREIGEETAGVPE